MHRFLINNRDELIARCKHKVAQRPRRSATAEQLEHGIPLFLDQLARTLEAEQQGLPAASMRISGASGGDAHSLSEIGVSAAAHGKELLELGFSVDQVVHDYGDLCQAITDLAFDRDAAFAVTEFRTLNRCLDNAIADAVTEFSRLREISLASEQNAVANERLGFLVHELRNALGTATLAVGALELSSMPVSGATGAVLKRSLLALTGLVERSVEDVRRGTIPEHPVFDLAAFIEDARHTAELGAAAMHCRLSVESVDAALGLRGNRQLLLAALANLLQNAFKFTHEHTEVTLKASATARHIRIEVFDHCGGLPKGSAEEMFTPFRQRSGDRSGLGLGLSIARQSIEADSGTLSVRDLPGVGCVFSIRMPRHAFVQQPVSG
ncbi:MAG: histidine kinase [Ramlibacter sp.]|nr:histidine kinase [Ramlibacter sp.]